MMKDDSKASGGESDVNTEGWDRFTHAVDVALRTKPKHKAKEKVKSSPKPKRGSSGDA